MKRDYDVVVVGAGGAGMAAAITARDAGASVIVLEADDRIGGSTSLSGGVFYAAGTSVQRAREIEDTPDESTEDENKTPIEALAEDAEAEPVADEPSDELGEDVEAEPAEEDGELESDEKAPVEYTIKLDASELIAEMKSLGAKLEIWINEKDATPAPEPEPEPQALTDEERAEIVDKLSQSIKDKVRMQTTGALPD